MTKANPLTYEEIREYVSKKDPRFTIIDVRRSDEFNAGHIETACNIPITDLKQAISLPPEEFKAQYGFDLPGPNAPDRNIIVHCQMGGRARRAVSALAEANYSDNLYAYYPGWAEYSSKQT
ncbi:Thiosulfate sulfurtransferase/rhodanese-like domain-containing protein 3 [Dipsacomyces acuminosporus]|nr:Thiosulfate sulfurtransferase/rhodanese-like domain-containing protein 3 [Dipsacomyces acuminosporus]